MTITAQYDDITGENIFSFHTYVNNKPTNNTVHKKVKKILPDFDDNEFWLYEGDKAGFFVVIEHNNEPVKMLKSFISLADVEDWLDDIEIESDEYRSDSELVKSYIATEDFHGEFPLLKYTENFLEMFY
ncbi:MAG TPA: hypothetical protein ENJ08_11075, partial [Gammaproteobacteria bacterium]|nr:hypothetical protein [Gammaproteobacteria bacterium]